MAWLQVLMSRILFAAKLHFDGTSCRPRFEPLSAGHVLAPWLVLSQGSSGPGRGPFLETPGNLRGPKSYFEIKVSRKTGCVLSSNEVHIVSLANNFAAPFSKRLKLQSLTEIETA